MSAHLRRGASPAALFLCLALTATPLLAHAQAASRVWSTYLGGQGNERVTGLLQFAASREIVATGWTNSKDFPPRTGTGNDPARDAFVAFLTPGGFVRGNPFLFGGTGEDMISAAAFGSSGQIYVVGMTQTAAMPGFPNRYRTFGGLDDAFLARFKTDGTPEWFMYLESPGSEMATGVTVSGTDVYVTGFTNSCAFMGNGTCLGGYEGFVVKVDDSKTAPGILWTKLLMGNGDDFLTRSLVDGSSVVVVGSTNSSVLSATSVRGSFQGATDALAAKLDAATGSVTWATYLGSDLADNAATVLPGANGETAVVGTFGTQLEGKNISVTWLNTSGAVQRTRTFGGSNDEVTSSATMDDSGNLYIAGKTNSRNFPLAREFDSTMEVATPGQEGFVLTLPAQGGPGWASFVGGNGNDDVAALNIVDNRLVLAGDTSSGADLATSGSYDGTLSTPPDAFLMALDTDITPPRPGTVNDRPENDLVAADIDTTTSLDTLSANWGGFLDGDSGMERYEYAIGTSPGGQDVLPFTGIPFSGASSYTKTGLSLMVGTTYYFSVRGINGAGLGAAATSDGVLVVPVATDGGTGGTDGGTDGGTGNTDGGTGNTDGGTGNTDGGSGGDEDTEDKEALLGFSCTAADAGLPMLLSLVALVLLARRRGPQSR